MIITNSPNPCANLVTKIDAEKAEKWQKPIQKVLTIICVLVHLMKVALSIERVKWC